MMAGVETPRIPVVLEFHPLDLDVASPRRNTRFLSRNTSSCFQDYGNSGTLRHRYRDYTVRDEAIKVIPNRRPAWIKLRRVRDLNASSDCGLFWTLAGEEVANALRVPLRRLQIDPG